VVVGAASRSVLPTIGGTRDYLDFAPGWDDISPDDPGAFFPAWDQGPISIGGGDDDASWVHDDLRVTAVAIAGVDVAAVEAAIDAQELAEATSTTDRFATTTTSVISTTTSTTIPTTTIVATTTTRAPLPKSTDTVVIVSADLFAILAADGAAIERRAKELLDDPLTPDDALKVIVTATHNHHGPDTVFDVNPDWYAVMVEEAAVAIVAAVTKMEPAVLVAASGEHRFGVADARDPLLVDPRVNVLQARKARSGKPIATIIQWANHPATTFGWSPVGQFADECAQKGWPARDCSAEGRFFTSDFPGILRKRMQTVFGGEVMYLNGAIGSQLGPRSADVWRVDEFNPLGDGLTVPADALPVGGAEDFRERNFARTQTIGDQLALTALSLILDESTPIETDGPVWSEEPFYTPMTNLLYRSRIADRGFGWQQPVTYSCGARPYTDTSCVTDRAVIEEDPLLTQLTGGAITVGNAIKSRLVHIDFGDVGLLFVPGELAPELVIEPPFDFVTNIAGYYRRPDLHVTGPGYAIPKPLAVRSGDAISFTVGLGGDWLGQAVPISDARLTCFDRAISGDVSCDNLFGAGYLLAPDSLGGATCQQLADAPPVLVPEDPQSPSLQALLDACRYAQVLGISEGVPDGHAEELDTVGWDLLRDIDDAATRLFGR
jgi:hypothetical protein